MANLLYLDELQYVKRARPVTSAAPLAITAWVQYVLDSYASVAEAVETCAGAVLRRHDDDARRPSGQLHLSISDETGDLVIFEYLDGKLVIHHGREYQVMTNSPAYDAALALNAYWETVGGRAMLPGPRGRPTASCARPSTSRR